LIAEILIETLIEETLTAEILFAQVRTLSVLNEALLIEKVLNAATQNVPEVRTWVLPNEVFRIVRLVAVVRSYQVVKVAKAPRTAAHFALEPQCESAPHFYLEPQCEQVPHFLTALQFRFEVTALRYEDLTSRCRFRIATARP